MFAGISKVEFGRFTKLNAIGATLWLAVFMVPGYFLGNLPLVKQNLETAVLIVIIVSSLPFPLEIIRTLIQNRRAKKKQEALDREYEIAEGYTDPEKLPKKDQ
jgi:membrane-associated protein